MLFPAASTAKFTCCSNSLLFVYKYPFTNLIQSLLGSLQYNVRISGHSKKSIILAFLNNIRCVFAGLNNNVNKYLENVILNADVFAIAAPEYVIPFQTIEGVALIAL